MSQPISTATSNPANFIICPPISYQKKVSFNELKNYVFNIVISHFHRNEKIDQLLSSNHLMRKPATTLDNNCLLDTIFQQIPPHLRKFTFSDFVASIRQRISKTKGEQLSINDEFEGIQVLSAIQNYLYQKTNQLYQFDLTVLFADNDGEIGFVDMAGMEKQLHNNGEALPIKMIVVNYNHYEPLFPEDLNVQAPKLGRYERKAVKQGAKWIGVNSGGQNQDIFDFVLIQLGLLDPSAAPLVKTSYHSNIAKTTTNFSRLFEAGKLLQKGSLRQIEDISKPSFEICSPRDLLEGNLTLKDLSETVISQNLVPPQKGDFTALQRLRLTQTKFLNPVLLSQMTDDEISTEEALSLITCLGLQKDAKKILICDPKTGNFNSTFQKNMLEAGYKLIFHDPAELLKDYPEPTYHPKNVTEDTYFLFEGTKLIAKTILEVTSSFFSPPLRLVKELMEATDDHLKIQKIISEFQNYFPPQEEKTIFQCKEAIEKATSDAFKKCQELLQSLPNKTLFFEELKKSEARARLNSAINQKDLLRSKFDKFKAEILSFVELSSKEYTLKDAKTFEITWLVKGIEIKETMEVTKTCAISRRVLCPKTSQNNRPDLVYFSQDIQEESVVSLWNQLCHQHPLLSDCQLADYLLSLYKGDAVPDHLIPFLAFLMILLLGKEPAYDSASFAANFILLLSIKLGVHTFEEALRGMPMIPQGAIAAKQFLLHVGEKPLDALSRVQYKDKKHVAESVFLPTSNAFLGSADSWIQIYDNVATTALECCRRLFFKDISPENPHLMELLSNLKPLFETDDLDVWDIPTLLKTFAQRKELLADPKDTENLALLQEKNQYAARFLKAVDQIVKNESHAAEQCAKFLTDGIDLSHPPIQALQQIIDQQDRTKWENWLLSELKEILPKQKDNFYEAINKMILDWDPCSVFQAYRIDLYDYSDEAIKKWDQAWNDHFTQHLSIYASNENFVCVKDYFHSNYRLPISYYELAAAINPENAVDKDDPLALWAISYILALHPLSQHGGNI